MMNSHMPKGRGMIKWQAFASLPEQFHGIRNIIQEQTKIEKPILDAQQLEEIGRNIQQAILSEEGIHLSYFRNGHIHHEMVTIINVDFHNKQLITINAFRNRTIFPIRDIVGCNFTISFIGA